MRFLKDIAWIVLLLLAGLALTVAFHLLPKELAGLVAFSVGLLLLLASMPKLVVGKAKEIYKADNGAKIPADETEEALRPGETLTRNQLGEMTLPEMLAREIARVAVIRERAREVHRRWGSNVHVDFLIGETTQALERAFAAVGRTVGTDDARAQLAALRALQSFEE